MLYTYDKVVSVGSREKSCLCTSSPAAELRSCWTLWQGGRRDHGSHGWTGRTDSLSKWRERESARGEQVWRRERDSGQTREPVSAEGRPTTMLQRSWKRGFPYALLWVRLSLVRTKTDCEVLLDFREMGRDPMVQRTHFQVFLIWLTQQIWVILLHYNTRDLHRSPLACLHQEKGRKEGNLALLLADSWSSEPWRKVWPPDGLRIVLQPWHSMFLILRISIPKHNATGTYPSILKGAIYMKIVEPTACYLHCMQTKAIIS